MPSEALPISELFESALGADARRRPESAGELMERLRAAAAALAEAPFRRASSAPAGP